MSRANNDMMELLKTIAKDLSEMKISIKELQEDNASSAVSAEKMYKDLNMKFDIFKNLESQSREIIQQKTTSDRKLTRPALFKKLFTEEREKYLNTLYTQDEIDTAFNDDEVQAKKKESDRVSKVVNILYTKHIKGNSPAGRANAFSSIYEQLIAKAE